MKCRRRSSARDCHSYPAGRRNGGREPQAYRSALAGAAITVPPECDPGHVYHLFPVLSARREQVRSQLKAAGIETLVHYPMPLTLQPALANENPARCPVAERACAEVFSLPLVSCTVDRGDRADRRPAETRRRDTADTEVSQVNGL